MHILLAVVAVLGGIAFFIWRVRSTAQAAKDVVEAVDDIRATARRYNHSRKTKANPLENIEDNRVAAATILAAFARMDGDYTREQLVAIKEECKRVFNTSEAEAVEITGQSRWLMEQTANVDEAIRRLSRVLRRALDVEEKKQLLTMVTHISTIEGGQMSEAQEQSLGQLSRQLA
ncbi:TerB family tellurite resistance protein [Kiloniella majae]|uniref:TerB family tellurite resistance protein n=1 Tax=Kiloniella majae TaxID=1938558 RepID=UPI000A278A82|nr:TerB family tellurite resistance protein [Kiloniella majae]